MLSTSLKLKLCHYQGIYSLPPCYAQSKMAEESIHCLRAAHTAPVPSMQQVYVEPLSSCSTLLTKSITCSVAGPWQNSYWQHSTERQHFKMVCSFFPATTESGRPLLKEPCLCLLLANRAHPRKCCYQTMLNSVLLCLGFLFKLSQVLHGF